MVSRTSGGGYTRVVKVRATVGADGGVSRITVTKDAAGNAISVTPTVTVGGKVVHSHTYWIGKYGGIGEFGF
jgi:hypothetical protein